ncbi:integral membrane sensor signal transduction histidine kinase [Segniliparus rotundus DSM 44985]|uniref:histidine kinase n=2 Tax=Segniliparus rotundus TaxID=286802 RepID=D6ZFK9_SEGRD|nr:integral membrane sensor signal transduction histidine kinase [Segniliparus rotundus DSM 44985]
MSASLVAAAVVVLTVTAYLVVSRALYDNVDEQLRAREALMIGSVDQTRAVLESAEAPIVGDETFNVMLVREDGQAFEFGQVPFGSTEREVAHGLRDESLRTLRGQRVLARRLPQGETLILARPLAPIDQLTDRLAWISVLVGLCGVVVAAVMGLAVAATGLAPVGRLTAAAERIARTNDLTPIPVSGHDELARLTESFNAMLRALADSRFRQKRLVEDAGHELRTPLTSLRTNLELLIAASQEGAAHMPEKDMADLRADVLAQIEEFSTLVTDLVDLAREDAPDPADGQVELSEVVDNCVERVRRRRADVEFVVELSHWFVRGDPASLARGVLNVLDNAAKWSPPGGRVQVRLGEVSPGLAELSVADEGPGIPEQDRVLVFERFYRATAARSMPGSGLGLAIVKQVMVRHGGTVSAESSPGGGALVRMFFPGARTTVVPDASPGHEQV